MVKTGSLL